MNLTSRDRRYRSRKGSVRRKQKSARLDSSAHSLLTHALAQICIDYILRLLLSSFAPLPLLRSTRSWQRYAFKPTNQRLEPAPCDGNDVVSKVSVVQHCHQQQSQESWRRPTTIAIIHGVDCWLTNWKPTRTYVQTDRKAAVSEQELRAIINIQRQAAPQRRASRRRQ